MTETKSLIIISMWYIFARFRRKNPTYEELRRMCDVMRDAGALWLGPARVYYKSFADRGSALAVANRWSDFAIRCWCVNIQSGEVDMSI